MSQRSLSGRTALVTGANRGLGLEVCRQLLERGARVVLTSRDLEKGRQAASSLPPTGLIVRALDVGADDAGELALAIERDILVSSSPPGFLAERNPATPRDERPARRSS